ncbi:hypothetical protein J6590_096362, partial [Homalodisca vitripennis]
YRDSPFRDVSRSDSGNDDAGVVLRNEQRRMGSSLFPEHYHAAVSKIPWPREVHWPSPSLTIICHPYYGHLQSRSSCLIINHQSSPSYHSG